MGDKKPLPSADADRSGFLYFNGAGIELNKMFPEFPGSDGFWSGLDIMSMGIILYRILSS
jgi:hypothetical protein